MKTAREMNKYTKNIIHNGKNLIDKDIDLLPIDRFILNNANNGNFEVQFNIDLENRLTSLGLNSLFFQDTYIDHLIYKFQKLGYKMERVGVYILISWE